MLLSNFDEFMQGVYGMRMIGFTTAHADRIFTTPLTSKGVQKIVSNINTSNNLILAFLYLTKHIAIEYNTNSKGNQL